MIDFFTFQTLIVTLLSSFIASGIFYIKNKDLEAIKFGQIYAISLVLVNSYQISNTTLIIGFIPLIILTKYTSFKNATYYLVLSAIALINSTYTNFFYILLSNIIILISYFILFSKLIFKNETHTQTVTLDQKEWDELKNQHKLSDKLQQLIPGKITSTKTESINTVSEIVTIIVKYEK